MESRWKRRLRAEGGVVPVARLKDWGMDDTEIRVHAMYAWSGLIRVRRGWYCLPDTHPAVVEACRLGGRVACVSALALHGVDTTGVDDGRLHIEVPANSVLRVPADLRDRVRVHWARQRSPGDCGTVALQAARRQAERCRGSTLDHVGRTHSE